MDVMPEDKPVPPEHRVARYCFATRFQGGKISALNFEPRVIDEGRLSTNWVECPHVEVDERNELGARRRLLRKITRNQAEDRIAILGVGDIVAIGAAQGSLGVVADGGAGNPCHVSIRQFTPPGPRHPRDQSPKDLEAQNALARLARSNALPALD